MRLAYCTNGLAHHRPLDAARLLLGIGYRGIALTPDAGPLDPLAPDAALVRDLRSFAADHDLSLTVETGARYALDPLRKHWPSLMEPEPASRARRLDYYRRCLDLAVDLGAPLVSLWSGAHPEGLHAETHRDEAAWDRLVDGLRTTLAMAAERGLVLAFEPEPGMWVERPAGYLELLRRLGTVPTPLRLTLDAGHCVVTGDLPIESVIQDLRPHLAHVQLDDARPGVHEHLPFGRGELDLRATLKALQAIGYAGQASVELARDSHRGPELAASSYAALQAAL